MLAELAADILGDPYEPDPTRVPGQLSFYICAHDADGYEAVGEVLHHVEQVEEQLIVRHKQHNINRMDLRRRGFMTALLKDAERWYADLGIASILMQATGDGSLFAARRGFDFDLAAYRTQPTNATADERELRAAAVEQMMSRDGVHETQDGGNAPRRPSVGELLDRVTGSGTTGRALVQDFKRRLVDTARAAEPYTLSSPLQIAEYARDQPTDALHGEPLGRAVLRHTAWQAIKPVCD